VRKVPFDPTTRNYGDIGWKGVPNVKEADGITSLGLVSASLSCGPVARAGKVREKSKSRFSHGTSRPSSRTEQEELKGKSVEGYDLSHGTGTPRAATVFNKRGGGGRASK